MHGCKQSDISDPAQREHRVFHRFSSLLCVAVHSTEKVTFALSQSTIAHERRSTTRDNHFVCWSDMLITSPVKDMNSNPHENQLRSGNEYLAYAGVFTSKCLSIA